MAWFCTYHRAANTLGKMPRNIFSKKECDILIQVLERHRRRFKNQTEMAMALDLTQPSLSAILLGKWTPGESTARHIAALDKTTLEELLPDWEASEAESAPATSKASRGAFPMLETCVTFYSTTKQWSPWTIAAARAGYFGPRDFPAPDWASRLDKLEAHMAKGKRE